MVIFESTAMVKKCTFTADSQCMNASDTANTKQKKLANSANPQMVALIQSLAGTISTSSSGTEIKGRISHKKLNESVATALHSVYL